MKLSVLKSVLSASALALGISVPALAAPPSFQKASLGLSETDVRASLPLEHCFKDPAGNRSCRGRESYFTRELTVLNGPYLVFKDGRLAQFHVDLLHDGDYAKLIPTVETLYGANETVALSDGRETRTWKWDGSTCIARDESERIASFDCVTDASNLVAIDTSY